MKVFINRIRKKKLAFRKIISAFLAVNILLQYFLVLSPQEIYAQVANLENSDSSESAVLGELIEKQEEQKTPSSSIDEELNKVEKFIDTSKESINPSFDSEIANPSATTFMASVFKKLTKRNFRANEKIRFEVANGKGKKLSVKIKNSKGEEIDPYIYEELDSRTKILTVNPPPHMVPGKYTVEISEGNRNVSTQDFTWGVLALNPNKSIYSVNEKSKLAMAVLDFRGEMVCDAKVALQIQTPEGQPETLSTEKGSIKVNPECNSKEFTLVPDYEAEYVMKDKGKYNLVLVAETSDGIYSVTDSIFVDDSVLFDVERIAATRIYPPETYPVLMNIEANEDFEGIITEEVPASFKISKGKTGIGFDDIKKVSQKEVLGAEALGADIKLDKPFDGKHDATNGFGEVLEDPMLQAKYETFKLEGHDGLDFEMPEGTDVVATDDGVVVLTEEDGDYGTTVVIEHSWGKSYYGHLSKIESQKGDQVHKGEVIAKSGSTGLSTAPHLHFGIKPNQNDFSNGFYGKIDPSPYLGLSKADQKVLGIATTTEEVQVLSWDVKIQKGEKITLSYEYLAPQESPQFYTTGPAKFLNEESEIIFQEARKWQIAADAPTGNGMLVYDEDAANSTTPHYRTWSPSDLSSEGQMNADGTLFADVNHTIIKAAPTRNEYIRAALDESGTLNVQVFTGSAWEFGSGAPTEGNFTTSIGTASDVFRNFDLTYEDTSGDAMVIYEDTATDNQTLKYRIWDGSTWAAEATLDYSAVAEGSSNDEAQWVEVKSRNGGNEIMLGWKDITGDGVYGAVWDGDSWEDITLINGAGINNVRRTFDIAWEGTSDQGMIVYGTGTTTDHSVYDISGSSWTDGASSMNPGEAVDWINLAADPSTDYIAMIVISGASTTTSDAGVDIWNGSDWTTVTTPADDTDINTYGFSQAADVTWEATGDRALFVWRDGVISEASLAYMVYDRGSNAFQAIDDNVNCTLTEGGAGTTETVTSLLNAEDSAGPCTGFGGWAGTISGIKLASDPSSSDIMLLAANQTGTTIIPEAQLWQGDGTWLSQTTNMSAFEADASPGSFPTASAPYRAYDFAWRESSANNTGILAYDEDGANVNQPPHFRIWTGSDFGGEMDMLDYATNLVSESGISIVKAATTRDEYIAGRLATDGHLNIQVWDGDSWEFGTGAPDNGTFTKSLTSTNAGNRGFDIAYESLTGDAMVVYESTGSANTTLAYRTWNGTTWSSESFIDYSSVAEGSANDTTVWVELAGRSGGNEIMLGWQDKAGLGYYGAVWDGDSWEDVSLINGAGVSINQQSFDVAWEGTSDQGMILYGTGTTTDHSVYDISGSSWTDGANSSNPGGAVVWLRLDNDPSSDYMAAIIIDTVSTTSSDIQVDIWNGTDWTTVSTPTADADIDTYGFSQGADVAWEQSNSGGRALFVWREDTTNTTLNYMVYDRTANAFQAIDDNSVCTLTEGGAGTTETVTAIDNAEDSGGPCSGLGTWAGTVSGIILVPDPGSNIIALVAQNETVLDIRPEMQLWNGDGTWLSQTATMGAFETDASPGTLATSTMSWKAYSFAFNKFGNTAPDAPTLYDVPFDNEKTADTTPNFEFEANDPEANTLIYHIQIDDTYSFASPVVECTSASCSTGSGTFSNTEDGGDSSPFTEEQRIRFTPSTTLSNATTYYWRVRANDGSLNGSYSSIHSFTIDTGLTTSKWFQTTDEQFDTGTLTDTETSGSDSVGLAGGSAGVAVTNLTSDKAEGVGSTPTNTASISPAANAWLIVSVVSTKSSASILVEDEDYATVSGLSLTWTMVQSAPMGGASFDSRRMLHVFKAYTGSSPGSGALTITNTHIANNQDLAWIVDQATGVDATTPFTGMATGYQEAGTTVGVTIGATPTNGDYTYGFAAIENDETMTVESGWTQIAELSASANVRHMETDYDAEQETSPAWSWSTSASAGAIGFVISAAKPSFVAARSGTGMTTAEPTGTTTDDIVLAIASTESVGDALTPATGFTIIGTEQTLGGVIRMSMFWARRGGSAIATDWSSPSSSYRVSLITYRGVKATGSPINTSAQAASDTTFPSVTTTVDGCLIVGLAAQWTWGLYDFSGFTNTRLDQGNTDGRAHGAADDGTVDIGSTGTIAFSTAGNTVGVWTIALEPASSVTSGTVMSPEIDYDWISGMTSWDEFDWSEDETDGTIKVQLYYTSSTACDTIVPNVALSNNSTGFTTGPIDISGLNTTTYNRLCLLATLADSGGTPYLLDWTVSWSSGSETPSLAQLMRHGRWFNSSGVIQPFTF